MTARCTVLEGMIFAYQLRHTTSF